MPLVNDNHFDAAELDAGGLSLTVPGHIAAFHLPWRRIEASSEHAQVEFERFRIEKADLPEVGVAGIQEQIPFAANCRGRNE